MVAADAFASHRNYERPDSETTNCNRNPESVPDGAGDPWNREASDAAGPSRKACGCAAGLGKALPHKRNHDRVDGAHGETGSTKNQVHVA